MVFMTDGMGNIWRYEYDRNGRIVKTIAALGGVVSTVYDKVGRTSSVTDANGGVTTEYRLG